jgi:hypothetical protein
MVAAASTRKPPLYDVRSFRTRDSVGARVALARKALADELGRELEPLGLGVQQVLVLVLLADEGVARPAWCAGCASRTIAGPRASSSPRRAARYTRR